MSYQAKTPHLGSSLSCIDLLTVLYWSVLRLNPSDALSPFRDRFLLSKGHAAPALYATLAKRGFFEEDLLETYAMPGGCLAEHPAPFCVSGVEAATGALGHGLSIGLGMALAAKISEISFRVFVLLGDGESNEGSNWEAAMMAPMHFLDNLIAIIDFNKWQATGRSTEVFSIEPFQKKWESFGWDSLEVDGHNHLEIFSALQKPRKGKPLAIIAHTVKGKGVSFMENNNNWHYRIPSEEEFLCAIRELEGGGE